MQKHVQLGQETKADLETGGATLEWHVKELSIKQHRLLSGIAGRAATGELLVILGPSGCGKTSLLECLSLRNRGFTGALHFNGKPAGHDFLSSSSVVYQSEAAHGFLTPREHLTFHATARMSRTHSRADIAHRVEEVIAELNLEKCADTRIGGANAFYTEKGISGGERKRVMIGTELLFCPQVLFLDEPTSGLDSSMADGVMQSLDNVTRHGTMVITSLHSPPSSWAPYFTHLLLMTTDGRVAYHGPYSEALAYFEGLSGASIAKGMSTSEFLLKRVSREPGESASVTADRANQLVTSFKASPYSVQDPLPPDSSLSGLRAQAGTHSSIPTLMLLNAGRCSAEVARNRIPYTLWTFSHLVIGFVFGALFYQTGRDTWRNIIGQLLQTIMSLTLLSGLATGIVFSHEWPKVVRECLVGRNAAGPFVFGRFIASMLYIPGAIGMPIAIYWMSGFYPRAAEFLIFLIATILVALCAAGIGLFCSSFSNNILVGLALTPAILMPMWTFSGVVYQKSAVPVGLKWLEIISIYNYGFSAMLASQVDGLAPMDRAAALAFAEVDPSDWPKDLTAMMVISIGFYSLAYVSIRLRLLVLNQSS